MWIVKTLEISDYDLLTNDVVGFEDKAKAEEYFKKQAEVQRKYAEENGWIIDVDTPTDFETWEDGSAAENAGYVYIEELKMKG